MKRRHPGWGQLMLPAYWRAVQAVAAVPLDRHGLTGAEVGRITFEADGDSRASAPGAGERRR